MRHHSDCNEVSPQCPVSATTYGYRPNFAGNVLFLAIFALLTLLQLLLGLRYRLRAFTFAISLGCLGEAIGYAGRLLLNDNPWSSIGFKIQICCLIFSPSFLAAGIYLTLKHLVIYFGPEMSRIKPKLYTQFFITCDVISIVMQAAGGGMASSETADLVHAGNDLMIAGVAFQVGTMFVCLCLAVDFGIRVLRRHGDRKAEASEMTEASTLSRGFRFYAVCCSFAFVFIFIRCVYRLPEMATGWASSLMRNELEFMILDGTMVCIAAILLTVAHPGIFFPAISSRHHQPSAPDTRSSSQDEEKMSAK